MTSSTVYLGAEGNPLVLSAENCRRLRHDTPVLLPDEFGRILSLDEPGLRAVTLPALFRVDGRGRGRDIESAMDTLFRAADIAIQGDIPSSFFPIWERPAVWPRFRPAGRIRAASAPGTAGHPHQGLNRGTDGGRHGRRIMSRRWWALAPMPSHPALAYEVLDRMAGEGRLSVDAPAARERYRQAVTGSLIKIMSKMGISTVRSYHGAQIFEALGISKRGCRPVFHRHRDPHRRPNPP